MDQTTLAVRTADWNSIISQCESRPEGTSKRQWLSENGISEKKYYYWLRKIRAEVYQQMASQLPAPVSPQKDEIILAEIPGNDILSDIPKPPAVVIRAKKSTIELSGDLPADTLVKLVKVLAHAV